MPGIAEVGANLGAGSNARLVILWQPADSCVAALQSVLRMRVQLIRAQ
jgi:hypothetical protein